MGTNYSSYAVECWTVLKWRVVIAQAADAMSGWIGQIE